MSLGESPGTDAPVFIVGTGRCGSTIVDSVLSMHPDFSWMPSWVDSFGIPELALVNRLWALPGTDEYRLKRFFPTPVEPYAAFRRLDPQFSNEEPTEVAVASAQATVVPLIRRICRAHGNPRYLAKLVGRPVKITTFARLYPNAYFLHVTRELKPTLSSLLKVDFYTDWGSDLDNWPWETIPSSFLEFYERNGRTNEIGAAIGLYLNRRKVDEQLAELEAKRVVEVAYADFVREPVEAARGVAARVQLDFPDSFADRVRARAIYGDADDKWKKHFSPELATQLDEFEALVAGA